MWNYATFQYDGKNCNGDLLLGIYAKDSGSSEWESISDDRGFQYGSLRHEGRARLGRIFEL